jgi:hypothetical protein
MTTQLTADQTDEIIRNADVKEAAEVISSKSEEIKPAAKNPKGSRHPFSFCPLDVRQPSLCPRIMPYRS